METLKALATNYNIEILVATDLYEGEWSHSKVDATNIESACSLIQSELNLYSTPIIKASKLQRIIACANIKITNSALGGLMKAQVGDLYLSVQDQQSAFTRRRAFHHELFHCIDYNDDVYRYQDPEWMKINEPGFFYSRPKFVNRQYEPSHRAGFLTNYSMTAVWEDKAELYAHMVMHYKTVQKVALTDRILSVKVERMKKLLRQFCGDYNESFWTARQVFSRPTRNVPEVTLVTLSIWRERIERNSVWFVARKDYECKPLLFYSNDKLIAALKELGLSDFSEVTALANGLNKVELKVKVEEQKLYKIGMSPTYSKPKRRATSKMVP